jgi:ABC-type antimicrobial peptide transport system permease subunit
MLSIAAGVAAMVALRSLGLAVEESLVSNVREINHGDINLQVGGNDPFRDSFANGDDGDSFSDSQREFIRDWVDDHDGAMSEYVTTTLQIAPVEDDGEAGRLTLMVAMFIDPSTYPPPQPIVALEPKGVPLSELFTGGNEIVVSENLAAQKGIAVGDEVLISNSSEHFVVRGIVPTESEAALRNIFAAFFGFAYFDVSLAESLSVVPRPNGIAIALADGATDTEINQASDELRQFLFRGRGFVQINTVPEIIEENEVIADITGRFAVVMGLGAMLIGGVGIINTMLVLVRRRTNEIAALKTFGLKGRQIAFLFMFEGLILGFVGSLAGSIAGALLSRITNAYGATFIQQPLIWRIYPEALAFGVVLGLVVTGVFSVMPVLIAVRVRPNIILRPNETHIPALGVFQSLLSTLFVVLALGIVAGQIIGPFPDDVSLFRGLPIAPHIALGIIGVAVTLTILAILVGLLWILVWIVGKAPAFGSIDLRLALTNLRSRRLRTATTLLAISVGMFAISSISFYGAGAREILQLSLTETFGGNVILVPLLPDERAQPIIDEQLATIEGIQYRTYLTGYDADLTAIDGNAISGRPLGLRASVRDTSNPKLTSGKVIAGRSLNFDDRGQMVAVIKQTPELVEQGVTLGSSITIRVEGRILTFEVVGIASDESGPSEALGDILLPAETLGEGIRPDFQLNVLQVDDANINQVMAKISSVPFIFALDITFIDSVLSRLIDQFSALPFLVGLLSLMAAAVIMANTVALATLERRKQIGILKAIGLKSKRVLLIMLLENVMVSLLGAILGIGLSALGLAVMTLFGLDDFILIPQDARPIAIGLVIAAGIIGSVATILSANVAVRERVLNVLRYE